MKKYIIAGAIVFLFSAFSIAHANPSFFSPTVQTSGTSVATTTVTYMSPGTATTTLTYDTYTAGNTYKTNAAVLFTQLNASSTSSILNIALQYSQDGVDWYANNLTAGATTTATVSIAQSNSLTWTTPVSGANLKAVQIETPTRFVRAIYSIPIGAGNGALWAQIIPNKETHE